MALSAIPGSAQPADHLLVALADARRSVDVLAGTPRSTSICPTGRAGPREGGGIGDDPVLPGTEHRLCFSLVTASDRALGSSR